MNVIALTRPLLCNVAESLGEVSVTHKMDINIKSQID